MKSFTNYADFVVEARRAGFTLSLNRRGVVAENDDDVVLGHWEDSRYGTGGHGLLFDSKEEFDGYHGPSE